MNLPIRTNLPDDGPSSVGLGPRTYAIPHGGFGNRGPVFQDEAPVFVVANLRLAAGFPLRALQRNRRMATWVFSTLVAVVALAIAITPKHYEIETRFFAEKNFVMPGLANPKRSAQSESDSPTRLASEAVMKRTNLTEIIRQTKLLQSWDLMRSPLGRAKDAVMGLVKGPPSDADRLDALLGMIEKRMYVDSKEGTVAIVIDWPDAALGYRIVQAAQQNFFEQRHAAEVSLISESIQIIEARVDSAENEIQLATARIRAVMPPSALARLELPASGAVRPVSAPRPSAAVQALQAELRTKQQTIDDIAASRNQRLVALQVRLSELRGSYGSAHPDVQAAEENLRALNVPSPQLATLREEASAIRARLGQLGAATDGAVEPRATSYEPSLAREALASLARVRADTQETPEVTFAKSRLKIATTALEDKLDRLEGAKIELETARAAFKYRYSVITPAKIPKNPNRPKIPLLVIGGLLLAVFVTVFSAIAIDLAGGRILEAWQVDRQLGLPVIAEIQRR